MDDRDKRDYYRLPDSILVQYQFVSEQETSTSEPSDFFTSGPTFHLLRDIYELQLESAELLRQIQADNRALSRFLSNLDSRVALMTKSVMQSATHDDFLEECDAEISEGGISFISPEHLPTGQHLALQMLFKPSYLGLTSFGKVRHCRLAGNAYRIGVAFQPDIHTQRIISRHIISKQSEQRRARLSQRS